MREFGNGTKLFNATRQTLGLPALQHPFDQLHSLMKHLVMTSAAFDFQSRAPAPQLV